jgi:hypothetical protein
MIARYPVYFILFNFLTAIISGKSLHFEAHRYASKYLHLADASNDILSTSLINVVFFLFLLEWDWVS